MNLSTAELATLPLSAALLSGDDVVAATPEWRGAGPGSVTYAVRSSRLVVCVDGADARCTDVLVRLLDELDRTASAVGAPQSLRVAMLAASLRLVAGRSATGRGTSHDVLAHLLAGVGSRTALAVTVTEAETFAVADPPVAALVLVQLAVNAERHDHATAIEVAAAAGIFTVRWTAAGARPHAPTARRRAERTGWGLGFARIASDALGAALHAPLRVTDGANEASLELGIPRLALPLCAVRDGVVVKATTAWGEETMLEPGTVIPPASWAARCLEAAQTCAGGISDVQGWCTRRAGDVTWIAIPPDGVADRARDVLDGMVHERALWDHVALVRRVPVVALAAVLGAILGTPLPRVPAQAWNTAAPRIAASLSLTMNVPRCAGIGVVDPHVALFLAAEFGDGFEVDGDELHLRVSRGRRDASSLARVLLRDGETSLRLG